MEKSMYYLFNASRYWSTADERSGAQSTKPLSVYDWFRCKAATVNFEHISHLVAGKKMKARKKWKACKKQRHAGT